MTWQNQAYFADVTIKVLQAMDLYFHTKREKVKTDLNDEAWRLPFFLLLRLFVASACFIMMDNMDHVWSLCVVLIPLA